MLEDEIKEALQYLNPADCTYKEWFDVGTALKNEGFPCSMWDEWSSKDLSLNKNGKPRYNPGECAEKWETFDRDGNRKGIIFDLCKKKTNHVVPPSSSFKGKKSDRDYDRGKPIEEADTIINDPVILMDEPGENYDPVADLKKYLLLLFNADEYVGYCVKSGWNEKKEKWEPRSRNTGRTVLTLIQELNEKNSVSAAMGSYNPEAGAWILINPCDGKKAGKDNVTDYRYCLVESDNVSVQEQCAIYKKMRLPIAAIVYSGSRSAHAVVRVNARNKKEFQERVEKIFSECDKAGLKVDPNNRDFSRLTRMPGVIRGTHTQYLMCGNMGFQSYEEWELSLYVPFLPKASPLEWLFHPPEAEKEIIPGVLRDRETLLLAAQPKAGKSFLIQQLALAVSSGKEWIGLQCAKRRTLYIDGELSSTLFFRRMSGMTSQMNISEEIITSGMLEIINLKGKQEKDRKVTLDRIASDIEHKPHGYYGLVILDCLYKFAEADENDNTEMGRELDNIDRIVGCGSACIVVHHFSKGSQAGKNFRDKASGGGVIGRYFDTYLNLEALEGDPADDGKAQILSGEAHSFPRSIEFRLFFRKITEETGFHFTDENGDLIFRKQFNPKEVAKQKLEQDQRGKTGKVYFFMKENNMINDGVFTRQSFMDAYHQIFNENRDKKKVHEDLLAYGFRYQDQGKGKPYLYYSEDDQVADLTEELPTQAPIEDDPKKQSEDKPKKKRKRKQKKEDPDFGKENLLCDKPLSSVQDQAETGEEVGTGGDGLNST